MRQRPESSSSDHAARDVAGGTPAAVCGSGSPLGDAVEGHQLFKQGRHILERHHIGAVGRGIVRILMRLDEDAGDADGDRRPRQRLDEAPVTTRRGTLPARLFRDIADAAVP